MFKSVNCDVDVCSLAKGYKDRKALADHNSLFDWLTD